MIARPHARLSSDDLTDDDAAQIAKVFEDMADGFNAHLPDHADQHFTADAIVVAPDGARVEGHDALLRYHEHRFAGPASSWQTTYHVIGMTRIDDRSAVVHTRQDTTTGEREFQNHGTFIFVKRGSSWWIAACHNTNIEHPARAAASAIETNSDDAVT